MRWRPWIMEEDVKKATKKNQKEIEKVKGRLDKIEAIDVIAEELAVLRRNGD